MIVYVNGRFTTQPLSGVQRYAHEVVAGFDRLLDADAALRRRLRLVLLTPPRGVVRRPELRHVEIRAVGSLTGHAWEQLVLPVAARDGLLFCPGNTAPLLHLFGPRPTVVTVHDLAFRWFPDAYAAAFRALYHVLTPAIMAWAARVITVSEAEKRLIADVYPSAPLVAVANGGVPSPWAGLVDAVAPKRLDRPYALYVGSLSKRKNFDGLLQTAVALAREGTDFVFVGSGSKVLQRLDREVPDDVAAAIHFIEGAGDKELIAWYRGAEVFVFPSFYEASGLPPMEAMAAGVPVVASRIPALEERYGDAAVWCDPANAADILRQTRRVLAEPDLRADLIAKGRALAAQCTWARCAAETLAHLEAVAP